MKFVEGHDLLLVDNAYPIKEYIQANFTSRYCPSLPVDIRSVVKPKCWAIFAGSTARSYQIARELSAATELNQISDRAITVKTTRIRLTREQLDKVTS
ncbi:unnamed protein product, partial [Ectocarpus sp. 12 AP-2014]